MVFIGKSTEKLLVEQGYDLKEIGVKTGAPTTQIPMGNYSAEKRYREYLNGLGFFRNGEEFQIGKSIEREYFSLLQILCSHNLSDGERKGLSLLTLEVEKLEGIEGPAYLTLGEFGTLHPVVGAKKLLE